MIRKLGQAVVLTGAVGSGLWDAVRSRDATSGKDVGHSYIELYRVSDFNMFYGRILRDVLSSIAKGYRSSRRIPL